MDPTAQGTPGQDGQPNANDKEAPNEGIQKRIGELTAAMRQAEERASKAEQLAAEAAMQNAQLASRLMERTEAPAAEAPIVDPDLKAQVEAAMKPFLQRIEQAVGGVATRMRTTEEREVEAAVADPVVLQKARALQAQYTKQGVSAELQTCVDIVIGQQVRTERAKNAGNDAARRNANGGYSVLTGGGPAATGASGIPGGGNQHPASVFTPEYLNKVGSPGFSAEAIKKAADAMPDLPLRTVRPRNE